MSANEQYEELKPTFIMSKELGNCDQVAESDDYLIILIGENVVIFDREKNIMEYHTGIEASEIYMTYNGLIYFERNDRKFVYWIANKCVIEDYPRDLLDVNKLPIASQTHIFGIDYLRKVTRIYSFASKTWREGPWKSEISHIIYRDSVYYMCNNGGKKLMCYNLDTFEDTKIAEYNSSIICPNFEKMGNVLFFGDWCSNPFFYDMRNKSQMKIPEMSYSQLFYCGNIQEICIGVRNKIYCASGKIRYKIPDVGYSSIFCNRYFQPTRDNNIVVDIVGKKNYRVDKKYTDHIGRFKETNIFKDRDEVIFFDFKPDFRIDVRNFQLLPAKTRGEIRNVLLCYCAGRKEFDLCIPIANLPREIMKIILGFIADL